MKNRAFQSQSMAFVFLFFLLLISGSAFAWSVKLHQPPPEQLTVEHLWHVDVNNQEGSPVDIKLHGWAEEKKLGKVFEGTSNIITLSPGINRITSRDITNVTDVFRHRDLVSLIRNTGRLPAGNYVKICIEVLRESDNTRLAIDCISHRVTWPGGIRIISPRKDAMVTERNPLFSWTDLAPPVPGRTFKIRICKVYEGQTPQEAIRATPPWFEQDGITTTSFRYPISARAFESQYCWQVTASLGEWIIAESEVWIFKYGKAACECEEWDYLNVSWDTESQSVLPCGAIEQTVFVTPGLDVTVSGVYLCNPNDPNICPVTYLWGWAEVDYPLQYPYTSYNSGNSGSQVDECNFNLVVAEGHCCTVFVFSYCGGGGCSYHCQFMVCADTTDTCECGEWEEITFHPISIYGDSLIECGGATGISTTLGTPITIDAGYLCDPSTCEASFDWEVYSYQAEAVINGGTDISLPNSFDFNPQQSSGWDSYLITLVPKCDNTICDTCQFTIRVEVIPECECGEWDDVEVLWIDPSGVLQSWNGSCGDFVDVPGHIVPLLGTPIVISTSMSCNPSPPCSLSYEWEVTEVGPGPPYSESGSNLPVSFSPTVTAGWNTFEVVLNADCDGTSCLPCTLLMRVRTDVDTCHCIGWNNVVVSWPGNSQSVSCGDVVDVNINNPGDEITITSSVTCIPFNADICGPSYGNWEVKKLPVPSLPIASGSGPPVSFDPPGDGIYQIVGNAECDGNPCPPCTVYLKVNDVEDTCKCGEWGSIEVSWMDPSGSPQSWTGPCNDWVPTAVVITPGTFITVYSDISCDPLSFQPDYSWEVIGSPASPPNGNNLAANFEPLQNGSYKVTLNAECCGNDCPSCAVKMNVKLVEGCECGEWDSLNVPWSLNVSWDGNEESVEYGQTEPILVTPGTEVTVSGVYSCNPDDPDICPDTYTWHVWDEFGNPITTNPLCPSLPSAPGEFSFTSGQTGCYMVVLRSYCDGIECDKFVFNICSMETECQCGEWDSLNVEWYGSPSPPPTGTWTGSCGDTVMIDIDETGHGVTITYGQSNMCINCSPGYPVYHWELTGPQNLSGGGPFIQPHAAFSVHHAPGTYQMVITAECNSDTCPSCTVYLKVDDVEDTCHCGEWVGPGSSTTGPWQGDVEVIITPLAEISVDELSGGPLTGYRDCGDTVTMGAPGSVTLNSVISCEPSDECEATYTYDVEDPNGNISNGNGHSVTLYHSYPWGVYTVIFTATCDGVECPPCTVYVEFEGAECPDSMVIPNLVTNTVICDESGDQTVVISDANQPGSWSNQLEIECGANWLWDNNSGAASPNQESHTFCTTFKIPQGCEVEKAKLYISVDDEAAISLNGWTGSASGYDNVTIISIPVSYLITGQNILLVNVSDDAQVHYDDRAGGIWCLYIYFQ